MEPIKHLKFLECLCVKKADVSLSSTATVSAKLTCDHAVLKAKPIAIGSINKAQITVVKTIKASPLAVGSISAKLSSKQLLQSSLLAEGDLHKTDLTAKYAAHQELSAETELINTNIDKLRGDFGDYECVQKLFPVEDIDTELSMGKFVGPYNQTGNLYSFIDEGVFTGDYDKPFGQSYLISDDTTFIQPNTYHTDGEFQYRAKLSNVFIKPEESRFRMRASAPLRNYDSKIPPRYTVHNIKLSDPSGNLIIQYNDIVFRGDADQDVRPTVNYTTFSSAPRINKTTRYYQWQDEYPIMNQASGYTISFDVRIDALDDAFTDGFDFGFEDKATTYTGTAGGNDYLSINGVPISVQNDSLINPAKNIRISAIEICNSGLFSSAEGYGPRYENYLRLYTEVPLKGKRIERRISPVFMPLSSFDTGISPYASSVWVSSDSNSISNMDLCGADHILCNISDDVDSTYATLKNVDPILNSGKLTLKFSPSNVLREVTEGAFNFAFNQFTDGYSPSGSFNTENKTDLNDQNGFFTIESLSLKLKAKKAVGSDNFAIDVVGYSDDKLLNITKAPSGFLQNSGIKDSHSGIINYPIVSTTSFAEYEVPLKIYEDVVELGRSQLYNLSSLFEHLYLDICPLPSGASVADIYLLARFAPQDGLQLAVQGGENLRTISDGRSEGKIFPVNRSSYTDAILNAGSGFNPLSTIANIPHAYSTPSSIKTNYSRRWKGMQGVVNGAFDVDVFNFGFENPHIDFPFLKGFYTFDKKSNNIFTSRNVGLDNSDVQVYLSGTVINNEIYKNIGWRFKSSNIFQNELAGYTAPYQTADWTAHTNGSYNFINHELYGQIADAFDSVVKVSGAAGAQYINVKSTDPQGIDTSGGFSVFLRFIPNANVSGANYNLFNSGVLVSRWNKPDELDFALGYKDGLLTAYAKDSSSNIITVQDTMPYSGYQYPLSVLVTYNDHESKKLKLYTDNELHSGVWNTLRASSNTFTKVSYNSVNQSGVQIGWSQGSGIGMNMLVCEFGLSTYQSGVYGSGTNIVEAYADRSFKQITAEEFLQNTRAKFFEPGEPYQNDTYKLWDYINEDTYTDWNLGDFRTAEFAVAFASLGSTVGKRTNRDLIDFYINHDGSGYIQNANFAMPTTINSGVAYHSQIENDFIRFHLSDTSDNFYSTHRRITKSLPQGYKFTENALVVDSIIEHVTNSDISWNDCVATCNFVCSEDKHSYNTLFGPKLIVSLYTKRQEPRWNTDEPNWGLINRDIHYIPASSCIIKLSSNFSYDNLTDDSEQWALFPNEPRYKDFGERYFSQDVDDMFLQYDIVYPSGPAFESNLKLHSAHVRLEGANVLATQTTGNMNIFASGGNVLNQMLPSIIYGGGTTFSESGLLLSTFGSLIPLSGLNLTTSGAYSSNNNLNLFAYSVLNNNSSLSINVSGKLRPVQLGSGAFNLVMPSILDAKNVKVPLSIFNGDIAYLPSGGYLNLFTYAASGDWTGVRTVALPMNIIGQGEPSTGSDNISLPMNIFGFSVPENRFPAINMPLFIDTPLIVTTKVPLFINSVASESGVESSGGMNLFFANYASIGSEYLTWYNDNYGTSIAQSDNPYASVPVGNEIRGVDLIGYGSCTGNSPRKAIDPAIVTDDTVWREETCEEGGIFRAINTYTNPTTSGFGDTIGYSGNYYGIRKFTGLKNGAPYNTTLTIITGNTEPIKVPRDLEDWEYGHCGPEYFLDSGCCSVSCDQSLVYSGVKLIGDYPYLNGDKNLTPVSGRNTNDHYGTAVKVVGDLMAVGSPNIQIPYIDPVTSTEMQIDDAGAVYLYRRNEDIPGKKAAWIMQDKLMLPSGYRKDFVVKEINELIKYDQFSISGKQWAIGQEGRKFGSSIGLCASGDRETVVIGAPFAQWTREFDNIVTSGIPVGMVVFTDSFDYSAKKVENVATVARKYNILYKYFSAPWNGGTSYEFQPQLDIKLLVFEISRSNQDKPPVKHEHDWFRHKYISRMDDKDLINQDGAQAVYNDMLSGVKQEFLSAFNYKFGPHSGIPPILGIFREKSNSAGLAAFYNPLNGKNIVDDFIEFYNDYAYNSGVIDPGIAAPYNHESGYYNKTLGASEDWAQTSIDLLNNTLNSGNLIQNGVLKYITSGVGQEWAQENAYEFQIPPSSGGRAYIFENENGVFNCVQEIKSFSDRVTNDFSSQDADDYTFGFGIQYNDRYAHSVAISKNAETVAIGSPFTTTPCEIFQRDDSENIKMYGKVREFLVYINDTVALTKYDSISSVSGESVAQTTCYYDLTQDNKLAIRLKYDIQLYKPIYTYGYSDIGSTGTWQFIVNTFAGTSRLGYSAAVSDDGGIVAFGAPTDSTNLFEDSNVWYKDRDTWASYTNAGAVRIFESQKIYPHSGVVEFTRFGNLDRAMHKQERDQGLYDQMGLYFEPDNVPFRRTDFEELEIPKDAGLAFIITPELDADSDEIIANIKDWLALGDRTLVLVGNDPIYEENGLYKKSNDIINRILKKLGSRMTIVPAVDRTQSLPDCISSTDVFNDKYNVTKSFQPTYNYTNTYISRLSKDNIFAKGVGDIKIDLSETTILGVNSKDFIQYSPCDEENQDVCNLPLKNLGDLRAEWKETCIKTEGDREVKISYKKNWPWHFANPNPAQACDDYPENPRPYLNRPYQDIVPVLTAAEWLPDVIKIIPARSGVDCSYDYCWKYITIPAFTTSKKFADTQENFEAFSILEDEDSAFSGIFNSYDFGTFFDPAKKNGRDPILQASGILYAGKPIEQPRVLLPDSILALEEVYASTTSNVILMASLLGENARSFGSTGSDEEPSNNDDQNILFYVNIIAKDCNAAGKVLQLGGWTGRSSFKDAYSNNTDIQDTNLLKEKLESYNIEVEENVVITDLTQLFPEQDPITGTKITTLWIANPIGKPNDNQIAKLKEFLDRGNKKVVITYAGNDADNRQFIAENVDYICDKLNISSRPCFVPSIGEYFVQSTESINDTNRYPEIGPQILNSNTIPTSGCANGYAFYPAHLLESVDTKVDKFALWPYNLNTSSFGDAGATDYIPISGGGNYKKIVSYNDPIKDTLVIPTELYKIDSEATITFPTEVGSGYKIFFNWVSETENDYYDIYAKFTPVKFNPNDDLDDFQEGFVKITNTIPRDTNSESINFIAQDDYVTVTFTALHTNIKAEDEQAADRSLPPFTPRVLSISGCPIQINTVTESYDRTERVPCDPPYTETCVPWYFPEQQILIPGEFRPIKHTSDRYCNPFAPPCPDDYCCDPRGEVEIEDGPVIVAEEFEHFSAGVNGNVRSKIVVITDSTIIQGQCPQYRSDALGENQKFIRSLYPQSASRIGSVQPQLLAIDNNVDGRVFEFTQKLRAPERGSAAKYYAISGIANMISPLYGYGGITGNLNYYVDNEDDYLPANPGFIRAKNPIGEKVKDEIKKFGQITVPKYGLYPRFSGDFLNQGSYTIEGVEKNFIVDADINGGLSDLMKLTGKDYLDFEYFTSGCVGDLFGFSVDLTQNKLVVGTPFNAFNTYSVVSGISGVVQWHEIKNSPTGSGIDLCVNGGAGSAFYFERTGSGKNIRDTLLPWEFKEKIKPSSINVGMTDPTIVRLSGLGNHNLKQDFIQIYGTRPDQFGYSVAIDADMLAVGAPNHYFASLHDHSIYNSGTFLRKEFNKEFIIAGHDIYDLGSSGIRTGMFNNNSGTLVMNNGAVFTYKHRITDWQNRSKQWQYAEKLYPQGYNDRVAANQYIGSLASGCENDRFGSSVSINRANRGDSDYTLVCGAPFHDFATSGNHPQSALNATPNNGLADAGSAYTFDGMLREQLPSIPNSGGWIDVTVFGDKGVDILKTRVYQPTTGLPQIIKISGIIFPNQFGNIFIEASGFDPSTRGFIAHRPYVESIMGVTVNGVKNSGAFTMNIAGQPNVLDNAWPWLVGNEDFDASFAFDMDSLVHRPSGTILYILGPNEANVYNNIALNVAGVDGLTSGIMPLLILAPSGSTYDSLNLNLTSTETPGTLNLNTRGR